MKKILLIEPDLQRDQPLKGRLESANFKVLRCSKAKDGIKATLHEQFDLLILDASTTDTHGMDLSDHINCPIIVMTESRYKEREHKKNKNIVFVQKPMNVLDNLPLILSTIEHTNTPPPEKEARKNHKKETLQISIGCLMAAKKLTQSEAYEHVLNIAKEKSVCKYLIAENILNKYEKKQIL